MQCCTFIHQSDKILLCIDKYQSVILWWPLNSTICFLYAVFTILSILYFFLSSSRHQCYSRMCKLGKTTILKFPLFWNRVEYESLGISWKQGRRKFLMRIQFCWILHLDLIKIEILFCLGNHSCVSSSGVGWVLHSLCDLLVVKST